MVGRHQATIVSGERLGAELFPEGKAIDEAYDPALAALEARRAFQAGRTDLLDRALVQQVIPRQWFAQLKDAMKESARPEIIMNPLAPDVARKTLTEAYAAGRLLVVGTESGYPMVVHGPSSIVNCNFGWKQGFRPRRRCRVRPTTRPVCCTPIHVSGSFARV